MTILLWKQGSDSNPRYCSESDLDVVIRIRNTAFWSSFYFLSSLFISHTGFFKTLIAFRLSICLWCRLCFLIVTWRPRTLSASTCPTWCCCATTTSCCWPAPSAGPASRRTSSTSSAPTGPGDFPPLLFKNIRSLNSTSSLSSDEYTGTYLLYLYRKSILLENISWVPISCIKWKPTID